MFSTSPVRHVFLTLVVFGCCVLTVEAQNPGDAKPAKDAADKKAAPTKVLAVYRKGSSQDRAVELGNELELKVANLDTLLAKAQASTPPKKIVLFLDGRPLKDLTPFPPTDPTKSILYFPLQRTESSRDVWTQILGKPNLASRSMTVSIGLEDGYPEESTATVDLRVIPMGWLLFWSAIFAAMLSLFWALALFTDLLRDGGGNPPAGRKAYSLARCQAAWWFFLALASYLFIGMITGDFLTTITGSVLVLIGISGSTAVGAAVIDEGKRLQAIAAGSPLAPTQNIYWWQDILSDAKGISFHRFQVAGWTLVLGIIFVVQVYEVLAMPTFDGTLLALMGISAGTYLGLKIPEAA